MARTYADLVYNGLWFSQTREAIDAFVAGDPAARHRLGPAQAVQRRLPRRRPQVAVRALRSRASRPTTRAIASITAPPKGSSRSGACRSRPRRARRPPGRTGGALSDGPSLVRPVRRRSRRGAVRVRRVVPVRSPAVRRRRDGEAWRGPKALERAGVLTRADASRIRAALEEIPRRRLRIRPSSRPRPRATTRTCTRSSSASWSRGSATPAAGCTPAARATSRSRSICGST